MKKSKKKWGEVSKGTACIFVSSLPNSFNFSLQVKHNMPKLTNTYTCWLKFTVILNIIFLKLTNIYCVEVHTLCIKTAVISFNMRKFVF